MEFIKRNEKQYKTKKSIMMGFSKRISIQLSPPRIHIAPLIKQNSMHNAHIYPLSTKNCDLSKADSHLSIIAKPAIVTSMLGPVKQTQFVKLNGESLTTAKKPIYNSIVEKAGEIDSSHSKKKSAKYHAKLHKGNMPIHASMDMFESRRCTFQKPEQPVEINRVKLPEVKNFNITVKVKETSNFLSTTSKISNSTLSFPKVTFKETSTPFESEENEKFPMSAPYLLTHKAKHLTSYEQAEVLAYKEIYFYGKKAEKVYASKMLDFNEGYDKEDGDYKIILHDHLGYRYEIISLLGEGSFGKVVKCYDHKEKECVAIKIIKNKKRFNQQALIEISLLNALNKSNMDGSRYVVSLDDSFEFRNHIVLALSVINLYELLRSIHYQGFSLNLIRRFAIQILLALSTAQRLGIIHCDLKPENILLKNKDKSGLKVIDWGSGCFKSEKIYTYIQSRFYRAPEIILGIPYTTAIDMWSFGCIMVELYTGYPIFAGDCESDQLLAIMEVLGLPSPYFIKSGDRWNKFFDDKLNPIIKPNKKGSIRKTSSKDLRKILSTSSIEFIDLILRCFEYDPQSRITPESALNHPWILEMYQKN